MTCAGHSSYWKPLNSWWCQIDWMGWINFKFWKSLPLPALHCVIRELWCTKMKVLPHNLPLKSGLHCFLAFSSHHSHDWVQPSQVLDDTENLTLFTAVNCRCYYQPWCKINFRVFSNDTEMFCDICVTAELFVIQINAQKLDKFVFCLCLVVVFLRFQ